MMENIHIFTATTKVGYSWYNFNSESNECSIEEDPHEWEMIKNYFPSGGHLPALSVINNNKGGITLCISGIKSHRLEKNTGQIVDTILISNKIHKMSNVQIALATKFLEASPLDINDPFNELTYSKWFTDLSECITNDGEGGAVGVNFNYEKFKETISESDVSVQSLQIETNNVETESDIALDTSENRLIILNNLKNYALNSKFPISLLITYGINPKELESMVFKGLTVHSKAKTDLSGSKESQQQIAIIKVEANRSVPQDQITENIVKEENPNIETSIVDDNNNSNKHENIDNAREQATQIEVDTNKILGIVVTSAGIVISLFHGKITIITSIITGAGVYLYSKRKKKNLHDLES